MNDSRTSPIGLLNAGKDFQQACEIISGKLPDKHPSRPNTDLYKVRLFLVGHAFELLFKAILLQCDVTVEELRSKKYGHDIIALLDKVAEYKLFSITDTEKELLKILNGYYKEKDFEYHVQGYKTYPLVKDLIQLGNRLFDVTEKWLRGCVQNVIQLK